MFEPMELTNDAVIKVIGVLPKVWARARTRKSAVTRLMKTVKRCAQPLMAQTWCSSRQAWAAVPVPARRP